MFAKVCPCWSMCKCSIPSYGRVTTRYVIFVMFGLPFISWWTFGLFALWDHYEKCHNVSVFTRTYVFTSLGCIPGVELLGCGNFLFNVLGSICLPPVHSSSGHGSLVFLLAGQLPSFSEHTERGWTGGICVLPGWKDIPLGTVIGSGMGMRQFWWVRIKLQIFLE